jgi:non-specific serine/threonine protein kinase
MGQDGDMNPLPAATPTNTNTAWAQVSRALRAAIGFAQEDLAAALQVSRKSIQRWERGLGAPDDKVELRLIDLLADRRIFERKIVDIGVTNVDELRDALSRARRGRAQRSTSLLSDPAAPGLIGRDHDIAEVRRLIRVSRLVTITGPGGVGKTSLAVAILHAEHPLPTAVRVELVEVRDAALVLGAIAERLNADERAGQTMRDTVVRRIGAHPTLLLLDNLEHLPEAAPIVDDLLESCPELHILTTSRVPLRLEAEAEFRLHPLAVGDHTAPGIELFVRIAMRSEPTRRFETDELATITELCARLDGLPLAIELAAARLRAVPLNDLHLRIGNVVNVLGRGSRDRPAHQQTLDDSIQWSFDLLSTDQQELLVGLGYFVGGHTMSTAEAMGAATAFDDVVALVEGGLLSLHGDRYRMLETVRDFAIRRRQPDADERFVRWATSFAEQQAKGFRGPQQRQALDLLAVEYANVRAALQQVLGAGDGANAHRLASALCGYWDGRSLLSEARRWLELTLATSGSSEPKRAAVHTWLGYFCAHQNDMHSAQAHATQALATWTELGIPSGVGYARLILGRVAAEAGRFGDSERELRESVRCLRDAGDDWGLIRPLNALGETSHALGRLDEARLRHNEALAMCAALGELGSQPSILCDIAHVALELGDTTAGGDAAEKALAIASELGNHVGVANALNALACFKLAYGDAAHAVELWAEADALHLELGLPVEQRVASAIGRDKTIALSILGSERYLDHYAVGEARSSGAGSPVKS